MRGFRDVKPLVDAKENLPYPGYVPLPDDSGEKKYLMDLPDDSGEFVPGQRKSIELPDDSGEF